MFITEDQFEGLELICRRSVVADFYLVGNGLEIGALFNPLPIPARCKVQYVDYKSLKENRARYPELANETIVETGIIDDGFILNKVENSSQDFIIANHALEHSPDAFGTLLRWFYKLKHKGIIYAAVPAAAKCFDNGRPITSMDHFMNDHKYFTSLNRKALLETTNQHIEEFLQISDKNIREGMGLADSDAEYKKRLNADLMTGLTTTLSKINTYEEAMTAHVTNVNRLYDIHYHTFTPSSYEALLQFFCNETGAKLENVIKNGTGEIIGVIRKVR
jgi:hypothetical protein